MEDSNELFAGILEISPPWSVTLVKRDEEACKVTVVLKFDRSKAGDLGGQIHGYVEREWRHLDTCQYKTYIQARVPRIKAADGSTAEVAVPWAERFSRVTNRMEAHAVRVLRGAQSHRSASKILGLGEGQLDRIMDRAVRRGLARRDERPIPHVGVDEKAMRRGHRYVSILTDIRQGRVLDLVEGRDGKAADNLWKCLSLSQLESVEAVALDMWPAYMKAVTENLPQADIVHDRFHISKHLGEAVDKVRKAEHRDLLKEGNEALKGSKYQWLKGFSDLRKVPASFKELYRSALNTAKAWSYKELFNCFWSYRSEKWAIKFFHRWYRSAIHTKLRPIKVVAKMLKRHLRGLIAYIRHGITNAAAEGLNSKIQVLRTNARGLPKFETFRTRVLFHCGGLDLSPHTN